MICVRTNSAVIDNRTKTNVHLELKRDFRSNFHRSNHGYDQLEGVQDIFAKIELKETDLEAWNPCRGSRRLVNCLAKIVNPDSMTGLTTKF